MDDIEKDLYVFIAEVLLEGEEIEFDADTPLLEYRLIDSLNVEHLMAYVEKEFNFSMEEQPPPSWNTIRKLAALIRANPVER